ncbi:hypothetical protein CSA80_03695 [Candidatus Saccharibacteria bacterium]|nr:MAG: hypothetical protein CSA80_03695 [Candidatus Saccharibacteria bacterium]
MQMFKRILTLAVVPSVLLTTVFGIIFTNKATAVYDPNKTTIADAAYSYQAYVALTTDPRAGDYVCGKMWTDFIDRPDITTFNWFQTYNFSDDTLVQLGIILVPAGAVEYHNGTGCNEDGWLGKALAQWGWGNDYGQFLDDSVYEPDGTGYKNVTSSGDDTRIMSNAIKNKYYSGKDPQLTSAMRYWIYLQNFTIGCGASTESPPGDYTNADANHRNKADTDDNTNHFWTVVDEEGTIQDTIWNTSLGRGKNITVGYKVLPNGEDYEANCGRLAELLRDKSLAEAFAQAMKDNPANKKTLSAITPSANRSGSGTANSCGIKGIEGPLTWIVCPLSKGLADFARFMGDSIGGLLYTAPETLFTDQFKEVWNTFRNIGLALVIIAGLIMVVSQAFGLELLDAYTIRKLMPRIAVVMIGMILSWPLLQAMIVLFNDLGLWAHSIIVKPFQNIGYEAGLSGSGIINGVLERFLVGASGAALLVGAVILGWAGILSLLFTIVLALLIGLLVLSVRQVIIIASVLLAPIAMAAYILPGTQKLWGFWKNTLLTTLAMFPIIMAFLASGEALSRMLAQASREPASGDGSNTLNLFALLIFFAPYFMLPFAFKLAGGLMTTIFSIANDKSRGLFDRARKFRQESFQRRKGEYATGLRGQSGLGRVIGNSLAYADAAKEPGVGLRKLSSAEGRQMIRANRSTTAAMEAIKNNRLQWINDDYALAVAHREGTTRENWNERYIAEAARRGEQRTAEQAQQALAILEQGSGAALGTRTMQTAAWTARVLSKTGYDEGEEGMKELLNDTSDMVRRGHMSDMQAMGIIKQSQRMEFSNISYGTGINRIHDLATYDNGAGRAATNTDAFDMFDSAAQYLQPSQLAGARHETIEGFANHFARRLNAALASGDNTAIGRATANVASLRDSINYYNPENKRLLADLLTSVPAGNTGVSVREFEEALRTGGQLPQPFMGPLTQQQQQQQQQAQAAFDARSAAFHDVRKEWMNQNAQLTAALAAANAGMGPGGQGQGGP